MKPIFMHFCIRINHIVWMNARLQITARVYLASRGPFSKQNMYDTSILFPFFPSGQTPRIVRLLLLGTFAVESASTWPAIDLAKF